jgi:hypothetical protein
MKNFNCQTLKHTIGLWSTLPQVQMSAFAGNSISSIRGSEYNDPRTPGSFIVGVGTA